MKISKGFISAFIMSFAVFALNAQTLTGASQNVAEDMEKAVSSVATDVTKLPDAQLAMSVSYYPVTAGDVYTLAFAAAGTPVRYTIPVDSTYKIRVANLGVINCAGLTYLQLKSQVESLVLRNYPMAGVQFVLSSPSTFLVSVSGEVNRTIERNAWALTRLSTFISSNLTSHASSRNITIVSAGGSSKTYDLFLAQRNGDLSQDPFLRPGDKIVVKRYERKVTVSGAVERPGTYELLKGENLKEAVERYAGGLSEYADIERIILRRQNNSKNPSGDTIYLDSNVIEQNYALENADIVTISSRIELRDTMFFEGAVGSLGRESQNTNAEKGDSSGNNIANPIINRIPVNFMEGENLATLVRRNAGNFFPTSDLRNAYLIRNDEKLLVNLEDCLYVRDYMSEYFAQKGDTLYVPYMQTKNTVLITGEVNSTVEVEAWPQKRLSALISGHTTDYSSLRDIEVTAVDGTKSVYDLFLANRYGQMDQNPYIRPGETITLSRLERKVTISGAVERPGTYQLLKDENLKEAVERYANGLSEYADTERIILRRQNNSKNPSGDTIYLQSNSIEQNFALENADVITISSRIELRDTMFFEGAVGSLGREAQNTNAEKGDSSGNNIANPIINRIPVNFMEGENLATLVRRNAANFFPTSDLRNAYLIRDSKKYLVNLEDCLYKRDYMSEYIAQKDDTLYVPYMQNLSTVLITGEVKSTVEVEAWPLKRLSTIISGHTTDYTSFRNIKVTSVDGAESVCDLFLATRYGRMENNPYIKPGEVITLSRIDRKVTINGAVERPGTYELKEGENIQELIDIYAGGLAPLADLSRIELYRSLTGTEGSGEKSYLDQGDVADNYELVCYDTIFVSSFSDLTPVVFVDGAIQADAGTALETSTHLSLSFNNGEDYAYFARRNKKLFTAVSDLEKAYIIRGSKTIPLNLLPMLYDASYYSNMPIEPNDTLVIPFKQYFVSVAGAVVKPGRYPYIPDRTWEYYIGLAGGFDKDKNSLDSIEIRDINNKKYSKKEFITPESTITANTNSFLYKFNKYAPAITTILSITASTLSIMAVTGILK